MPNLFQHFKLEFSKEMIVQVGLVQARGLHYLDGLMDCEE